MIVAIEALFNRAKPAKKNVQNVDQTLQRAVWDTHAQVFANRPNSVIVEMTHAFVE